MYEKNTEEVFIGAVKKSITLFIILFFAEKYKENYQEKRSISERKKREKIFMARSFF